LATAIITPSEYIQTDKTNKIIKNTGLVFDDVFLMKDAGVQYASVGAGKAGKGKSDLPKRIFQNSKDHNFSEPFYTGSQIAKGGWYIDRKTSIWFRKNYKEILKDNEWVHFTKVVFDSNRKIIWRQTADTIYAALMDFSAYFGKTIHAALIKKDYENKISYEYCLAILNSKYIDYIYRKKVLETGKVFPQVKLRYLRDLPFVIPKKQEHEVIVQLVKQMIKSQKDIRSEVENSNEWQKLKNEIDKIDRQINQKVYGLYGLTEKEIEIVEKNS
jgi:hypothetical protein